jgi:predicted DNA-binding antitoxin AbrB/MazE fold protein
MSEIVTAVYENGVLRPLRRLNLREHETVRLQILPAREATSVNELERATEALIAAGLVRPPEPLPPDLEAVSEERRAELARIFSVGKPLSEIIIEDRG